MKLFLKSLVVAAFFGASLVAVGPAANAVTEHCPVPAGSVKVVLDGSSNTVQTNLAPGTSVCVKAGTRITYVTVAADGTITQTAITNQTGKPLGISYYVGIPCTDPYGCEPTS
jgi:hypothetical protein